MGEMKGLILLLLLTGCNSDYILPTHYDDFAIVTYKNVNADTETKERGVYVRRDKVVKGFATYYRLSIKDAQDLIARLAEKKQSVRVGEIYGLAPQYINDERTTTIGHELWHVLRGDYHKQNDGEE